MTTIDPFYQAYRGSFTSVLRWPELEGFWNTILKSPDDWFIYTLTDSPPIARTSAEELENLIRRIDQYLREHHKEDYCGIVYADNKTEPAFIKIYDPQNLGVSCGIGPEPVRPGWIFSKLPPRDLNELPPLVTEPAPWWHKLLAFLRVQPPGSPRK